MKYRKKPVVIEAVVFYGLTYPQVFSDTPKWLLDAMDDGTIIIFDDDKDLATVKTLEGPIYASPGDYIIRGLVGELYTCKPKVFADSYEEAK